MDERIKKRLPEHIELYYVDYNDNLNDHEHADLLQGCVEQNSIFPIQDMIWNWWDCPEDALMDEIQKDMRSIGLEDLFLDNYEEVRDYLVENDESDPVKDLLKNTGRVTCYYDLGLELDCGWRYEFLAQPWRNESIAQCAYKVRRKLGIKKDSPEAKEIYDMLANCGCGGSLRIYFKARVQDLIFGNPYAGKTTKKDFQQICFNGRVALAVYNQTEGSGDFCYINLNHDFPFLRDNLTISKTDKYDLENCFGLCGNWLDKCIEPICSEAPLKKKQSIKASKSAELRKHEAELDAIYKAGGCTAGDMDMRRHRGVYYDNNIPCGHHCPHCGTFWID